jgi:hypothetical protein
MKNGHPLPRTTAYWTGAPMLTHFITTYNVLRQDLTVARAPPKRPHRADVEYSNIDRPRSPLVM